MNTATYRPIDLDDLTATDLIAEAARHGGDAYQITIWREDGTQHIERAQALYIDGRLGIAWGADATWADVPDVEQGIHMWLTDGEAWSRAN